MCWMYGFRLCNSYASTTDSPQDQRYEIQPKTTLADFMVVMDADPRTAQIERDSLQLIYERVSLALCKNLHYSRLTIFDSSMRKQSDVVKMTGIRPSVNSAALLMLCDPRSSILIRPSASMKLGIKFDRVSNISRTFG